MKRVIIFMPLLFAYFFCLNCGTQKIERKLIAFAGDSKIKGSWFLLGGSIDQQFVYRYLYKTRDGGVKQGYCLINNAVIYEKNDVDPFLVIYHGHYQCEGKWGTHYFKCRYEFVIPSGSIRSNYELDIAKRKQ